MSTETSVHWVPILPSDELWEGDATDVEVAGEHVLLARLPGGTVRAYQGICPHQEYLLIDSEFDWERGLLTCGGHHWVFRLADGAGLNPAGCQLFCYDVQERDGQIYIGVPQHGRRYNRCRE
jgi:toluene monooxygenase system ferredoxin subunit